MSSNRIKGSTLSIYPMEKYLPWVVTLCASLFFFYEFIQMSMFNAIGMQITKSFNLTPQSLANLSGVYFYANIIFLFPAGILLDRYSTKRIILISMAICVAGTLFFALANSYSIALLSRFLTGIGSAFCFISCIRLASIWFEPKQMALVTAIIVIIAMLGGMIAQKPLLLLADTLGWRHALFFDAMLGILIMLLISLYVYDSPHTLFLQGKQHTSVSRQAFWEGLRYCYLKPQNWAAAFFTSLMNMPLGVLGIVWGVPYLTAVHHLERSAAADITTMLFFGMIFGSPIFGYLSDKIERRKIFMIIGNLASLFLVLTFILFKTKSYFLLLCLFFSLGFFSSCQILSYPIVAQTNPKQYTAIATSIISFITQGGIAVFQLIFAYLMFLPNTNTHMHSFEYAILILPLGFVLALLITYFIKEKT